MKKTKIYDLEVNTIKKDIKNIHLAVCPPDGQVRLAVPIKTTDEAIKLLIADKMPWIKKQQKKYSQQERQTKREYVSGESHYFLGNRYRLNVITSDTKPRIEVKKKNYIDMYITPQMSTEKRTRLMESFYRAELKRQIPALVNYWSKTTGLTVNEVKIKKMKTKWGTCNPEQKRIWLNLELAKTPTRCLEYVLIHELMHLKEKHHNEQFEQLIKTYLPQWEQCKQELNNNPLGFAEWPTTNAQ
ncbi:MAG: M48 family metallopeptidase [Nitrososphaerota archaeon]|nr:M48 family metallopeptidase [Nitrososphaerota archaeon]